MAFDFKKEYKEFYLPKNIPQIVTVPPMQYVAVRGMGDPNEEGGAYKAAIAVLYAVAYTIKMSKLGDHRIDGYYDFVVPPLEGFWWQDGVHGVDYSNKSAFHWISVIRLPNFVTQEDFDWAVGEATRRKKLDCSMAEFLTIDEGECVQIMQNPLVRKLFLHKGIAALFLQNPHALGDFHIHLQDIHCLFSENPQQFSCGMVLNNFLYLLFRQSRCLRNSWYLNLCRHGRNVRVQSGTGSGKQIRRNFFPLYLRVLLQEILNIPFHPLSQRRIRRAIVLRTGSQAAKLCTVQIILLPVFCFGVDIVVVSRRTAPQEVILGKLLPHRNRAYRFSVNRDQISVGLTGEKQCGNSGEQHGEPQTADQHQNHSNHNHLT